MFAGFKGEAPAPATAFLSRLSTANMSGRISLLLQLCLVFFTALARAAVQEPLVDERPIYHAGDAIPVTCRMSIFCLLDAFLLTFPSQQDLRYWRACKKQKSRQMLHPTDLA
jgi:hypothetical protein